MQVRLMPENVVLIFKGRKECPKTVLINFAGNINNFSDVYISSDKDELQNGKVTPNNVGNNFFSAGVGLFNQGFGSGFTVNPYQIVGATSDIYARYNKSPTGPAFIDIEVDAF